ncbi:MAG TPA: flagellin [Acidimicrobiales bacterium]|nr:flagellin [Acidimicrobiales bacterium]
MSSSLSVNTNINALNAFNNLSRTSDALSASMNRLSSGLRVQTAADDPAGFVVSQYLTNQAGGYGVAVQNGQNAVSVMQVAMGALNQSSSILQTMEQLATQSANGGAADTTAQAADQQEFSALQSELDQIANTTQFGNTKLLDGSYNGTFQVGAYNQSFDQISVSIGSASSSALGVGTGVSIGSTAAAQSAISSVQTALATLNTLQAKLGATQNEITGIVANLTVGQQNLTAASSSITDTNMAQEMTNFTSKQILMQTGESMLAQANAAPQLVLKLLG